MSSAFMPLAEGAALVEAATTAPAALGPFLEVGSYSGNSASYLGPVAQRLGTVLFCVDPHRDSVARPIGWDGQTPEIVEDVVVDTLPTFRQTIMDAELEETVIAVVGASSVVAQYWNRPLSLLFLNGSHDEDQLRADFEGWVPQVEVGGLLVINRVWIDTEDGDSAPYEHLYVPAIETGEYEELKSVGSLRILRRIDVEPVPAQPLHG